MLIKKLAVWMIALPLAIVSGTIALGTVYQAQAPTISLSLWPTAGFAHGSAAYQILQQKILERQGEMPEQYSNQQIELAREGFVAEPTDTKAIMLLALAAESEGKEKEARQLMRAVSQLNRRNDMANLWLVKDYDKLGQIDKALENYDYSLRSSSGVRDVLIGTMANAMTRQEFVKPLASILEGDPPWASLFWSQLAAVKPALSNTGALRKQLHAKGIENPAGNDSLILKRMIAGGRFADAISLYESLSGSSVKSGKEQITNSNFSKPPILMPFDWEFLSDGGSGAAQDLRGQTLEVSTLLNAGSVVARQFLVLEPGQYILSAKVQDSPAIEHVKMQIRCFEDKQSVFFGLSMSQGKKGQEFSVSSGDCRYFWFEILTQPSIELGGYDLIVDHVSITKI